MTFQKGHKISPEVDEKRKAGIRRAAEARRTAKEAKLAKKEGRIGVLPNEIRTPVRAEGSNTPARDSHILTEINLKGEFDKMSEKINPKKGTETGKDMKYECGACGHKFNTKGEGGVCPGCGVELE